MHVALIDAQGKPEIHEELPTTQAPQRAYMLSLQTELNEQTEGKPGYRHYIGEDWPPAGTRLVKGKLIPEPEK